MNSIRHKLVCEMKKAPCGRAPTCHSTASSRSTGRTTSTSWSTSAGRSERSPADFADFRRNVALLCSRAARRARGGSYDEPRSAAGDLITRGDDDYIRRAGNGYMRRAGSLSPRGVDPLRNYADVPKRRRNIEKNNPKPAATTTGEGSGTGCGVKSWSVLILKSE